MAPTMDEIKASMRTTWMAGDFGVIAKSNARQAEEFVARSGIPSGAHALDVACGTGNLAIPLARQGCVVTGVDIATNLLAQGRERAAAEGLAIRFDEGDAEQLPYADASFDAVVTMFGAMFAPRPELVAAEFARVLKPGGLLAMGNWNPESFIGRMFTLGAQHAPPPPGIVPPNLWGVESVVRERLAGGFEGIETKLIAIMLDLPMNAAGAVSLFRRFFGPTQVAFSRLDAAGQEAFQVALEGLWSSANTSGDPDHLVIPNSYLQVTGKRR